MSRIGKKAITLPAGVTVTDEAGIIIVKGPKGELRQELKKGISLSIEDGKVVVARKNDERQTKAFHGLIRSLVNNMIIGVTQGYKKSLELVGTGYRVTKKGQGVSLAVGFSHTVDYAPKPGVTIDIEGNTIIHISGIEKQSVGQAAAEIRGIRPPEPYQGKGIRYKDEVVRRKAGKTAAK